MEKLIEEVIHEAETLHNKGHFIYSSSLKRILENSDLDFIIIAEKSYPHQVNMLLHIGRITLKYSYSPGLGSFPNEREKITAYGYGADIQHIKKILGVQ